MADVRSMLRAERAKRRITHPHASYTNDGQLLCNLCETFVKDEAHWGGHLHSTGHALRSKRKEDAAAARSAAAAAGGGGNDAKRKRKADEIDSSPPDERKKVKGDDGEDLKAQNHAGDGGVEEEHIEPEPQVQSEANTTPVKEAQTSADQGDDMDDQFAAFEREIAALDQTNSDAAAASRSALGAQASISAAPMTAEQLAADGEDGAATQRGKRDAELEAEREDAARVMEEEFDEMQTFEERLRKLRERREELRKAEMDATEIPDESGEAKQGVEDDDDDDESDYDDDDWNFRPG